MECLHRKPTIQSSLRDDPNAWHPQPWVETHGYHRMSLRDKTQSLLRDKMHLSRQDAWPSERDFVGRFTLRPLTNRLGGARMANTYTALLYHVVFSTKRRERWITPDIETRIRSYLNGIASDNDMKALCIGGIEDHVHLLLGAPPTMAPAKAAQLIKGGSSKWIHDTFPNLHGFAWQDGYGAFTVSKSNLHGVIDYIQKQREHHQAKTFQDEFVELLRRHEIDYEEKYLWD